LWFNNVVTGAAAIVVLLGTTTGATGLPPLVSNVTVRVSAWSGSYSQLAVRITCATGIMKNVTAFSASSRTTGVLAGYVSTVQPLNIEAGLVPAPMAYVPGCTDIPAAPSLMIVTVSSGAGLK
jgi:hypothetical protein